MWHRQQKQRGHPESESRTQKRDNTRNTGRNTEGGSSTEDWRTYSEELTTKRGETKTRGKGLQLTGESNQGRADNHTGGKTHKDKIKLCGCLRSTKLNRNKPHLNHDTNPVYKYFNYGFPKLNICTHLVTGKLHLYIYIRYIFYWFYSLSWEQDQQILFNLL